MSAMNHRRLAMPEGHHVPPGPPPWALFVIFGIVLLIGAIAEWLRKT